MTPDILITFIPISLLTLALCLAIPGKREKVLSSVAITGIALNLILFLFLLFFWIQSGALPLSHEGVTLYAGSEYTFAFKFYFDLVSAVFFGATCIITLSIFLFSKFYMHRDYGFKRFYNTVLIFFIGLTLIILAGNFETLFVGWEIIGISSFLLIAFYRDRFLPAKNALKVFTLYRIADAFLLIAIWYAHHLFEKNIQFSEITQLIAEHGNSLSILGILFLIVALIKSAQFPFSYWLTRAMEGPTTSSAIFYGALSVHMGLFLLLRTAPFWQGSMVINIVLGVSGLLTAIIATSIVRVQSSIKAQIAYASITQIGIMFLEVALGLPYLALFHFISNASLRTYQLLISPSIVGYLIHNQFFHFALPPEKIQNTFIGKLRASLYVLGIEEWNMDAFFSKYLWKPVKALGRALKSLETATGQIVTVIFLALLAGAALFLNFSEATKEILATIAAAISILLFIRAFSSKGNPHNSWNHLFLGHLFSLLFLGIFSHFDWLHILMYLAGVVLAFLLGHLCFYQLERQKEQEALASFHGHMYEHSKLGNFFFLICLAFMAFPITPSFLGQEILLGHLHIENVIQILLFVFGYVVSGVAVLRIYAKVFFGPHEKTYHEIAYKSS